MKIEKSGISRSGYSYAQNPVSNKNIPLAIEPENISLIRFESHEIRIVTIDNGPWFVAKDVCAALEITDHRVAAWRLDADEKGECLIPSLGGNKKGQYSTLTLWSYSLASLALRRLRRFTSPRIDVTTKPAVVSPSSFSSSSSDTSPRGTRETICCDLLFVEPVAIATPVDYKWHSVYRKNNAFKVLTAHNSNCKVNATYQVVTIEIAMPWGVTSTAKASNHNVTKDYTMAIIKHTPTRSFFTYVIARKCDQDGNLGRQKLITVIAESEKEARQLTNESNLTLTSQAPLDSPYGERIQLLFPAGRIRVMSPRRDKDGLLLSLCDSLKSALDDESSSNSLNAFPIVGERYTSNDTKELVTVKECRGSKVIFFYRRDPLTLCSYPLALFYASFSRKEVSNV